MKMYLKHFGRLAGLYVCLGLGVANLQANEIDTAADFALKTCYESIDDISRVRSYAKLMRWEVLPDDVKNVMRPTGAGTDYQAWSVAESNQQFFVSVHQGTFRGAPSQVCQVFMKVAPERLVASIARKVRVGTPTTADQGMQQTSIYQLLKHPTVRLALMVVSKGNDNQPMTVVGFIGAR